MSQGTKRVTEAEGCEPGRAEGEGAMKVQRCRVWWALTLCVLGTGAEFPAEK